MLVRELMSTDVVTCGVDASLAEAVELRLDRGVGSCIVVGDDETPIGIVTESDALRVALETDRSLSALDVRDVGHHPVVTTEPTTAVSTVARTMAAEGVKKVPVMDGIDLVGIVTMSDVVWSLSRLRRELADSEALREKWGPN